LLHFINAFKIKSYPVVNILMALSLFTCG